MRLTLLYTVFITFIAFTCLSCTSCQEKSSTEKGLMELNAVIQKATSSIAAQNKDTADSCLLRIAELQSEFKKSIPPKTLGTIANIKSAYEFFINEDYNAAIANWLESINYFEQIGDILNICISLYNVCEVSYYRKDTSAMQYAKEAYSFASKSKDTGALIISYCSIAMIELIKNNFQEAEQYAEKARLLSEQYGFNTLYSRIYLTLGYTAYEKTDYDNAEQYFIKAFDYIDDSNDEETFSNELLLAYINLLLKQERFQEARTIIDSSMSEKRTNLRTYSELLKKKARLSVNTGAFQDAYTAYLQYDKIKDSLYYIDKTNDINKLLLQNENLMIKSNLNKMQNERNMTISISVILIMVIVFFIYTNRKKEQAHQESVARYKQHILRINQLINTYEHTPAKNGQEYANEELFKKIESMMKTGIYRDSELSLEKLSTAIGVNQTYVSNVINKYSGNNFNGYINTFRIEEATKMLSAPNYNLTMKDLCFKLGFNSLQSFYRVFSKEVGCPPSQYRKQLHKLTPAPSTKQGA